MFVINRLCLFLASFLIALTFAAPSFSWTIFGPKNYEQCVRAGLKDVDTNAELRVLTHTCRKEFTKKSKDTGEFDADLQSCGVNRIDDYWFPEDHPSTKKIIKNLTAKDLSDKNSGGRLMGFRFQNRNPFDIKSVRLRMHSGQCSNYEVAVEFIGGREVKAGTFGELLHLEGWLANKYGYYCISSVQPSPLIDKAYLYGYLKQNGFCD